MPEARAPRLTRVLCPTGPRGLGTAQRRDRRGRPRLLATTATRTRAARMTRAVDPNHQPMSWTGPTRPQAVRTRLPALLLTREGSRLAGAHRVPPLDDEEASAPPLGRLMLFGRKEVRRQRWVKLLLRTTSKHAAEAVALGRVTTDSGRADACGPARRHCAFSRWRGDARRRRSGSKRGCRQAFG